MMALGRRRLGKPSSIQIKNPLSEKARDFFINALQKTPSLLGAECQGVGTTQLHANERSQTEGL